MFVWLLFHFGITREGEEKKDGTGMVVIENKMALGSPSKIDKMDTSLWLDDTGASCHMPNNPEGMSNQVKTSFCIVLWEWTKTQGQILWA